MPSVGHTLALWERFGDLTMYAKALGWRAWMQFGMGAWERARADLELAASTRRRAGDGEPGQEALLPLLEWLQAAGGTPPVRIARALAQARDGDTALDTVERLHVARATYFLAERELLDGRPAEACSCLRPAGGSGLLPRVPDLDVSPSLLAWVYIEMGEEEQAETLLAARVAHNRIQDNWLMLAGALRVSALLHIRRGQWVDAEKALGESLELSHRMPHPYGEVKALYVYGQLHAAKGEPLQAREQYAAGLAICEQLGESLYRPHIERALAALPTASPMRDTGFH